MYVSTGSRAWKVYISGPVLVPVPSVPHNVHSDMAAKGMRQWHIGINSGAWCGPLCRVEAGRVDL
ncbi:hypothetical protein J6590_057453 [Homalodisca vitripennis]|nr:hypothetical protein J6590_057453 [Homalodisca vitripennis]